MSKTVYLTIDDGPSPHFLDKLDFLTERGIPAVWFCPGEMLELRPKMALEALRRGYLIANHSYTHPYFSHLTRQQAFMEIRATDSVIADLYQQAGIAWQHRFFRFPYGDKGDEPTHREAIQHYLRKLGYVQPPFEDITYAYYCQFGLLQDVDWYWTYDSHDWCPYNPNPANRIDTEEKVLLRLDEDLPEQGRGLNYTGSADLLLIHDLEVNTPLFKQIIERLLQKGVEFRLPV